MPDFFVRGNPGSVLTRAATMRGKAESFTATADGLSRVTTDGWTSRAADRFREKFDTEPERWRAAGDGFRRAAGALEAYAETLTSTQQRARWAEAEYARGEQVTRDAQAAYDADVARARSEAAAKEAAGMVVTLTIVPFADPGEAVRQGALAELAAARADLESAAHACASGVRAGCAGAPEERAWYESVGAAVGGFLQGAGEALLDLGKIALWLGNPAMMLTQDLIGDARSGMTAEEIAAKWRLKGEDAQGMLDALQEDPVAFGKQLGKAMLDWDTWADDPARALGHLVPDAIAAVFTAGTGAVATRGVRAGDDVVDGLQAVGRMDDLADVRRLDDLGDGSRVYSMMDESPHAARFAPEQLGSAQRVDDMLRDLGVDRSEFIDIVNTPIDQLTDVQRSLLGSAHERLTVPDGTTVMQKVIPQPHFDADGRLIQGGADDYLMGREGFDVTQVRGSVTVASDSAHVGTPADIYDALRLDYPGSSFRADDISVHVVRFTADEAAYEVPLRSDLGGSGRYDTWGDPFTGNGFTKSADDVLPEYQVLGKEARMQSGAEMWEISGEGNQRLVAVLRGDEWIPQRN